MEFLAGALTTAPLVFFLGYLYGRVRSSRYTRRQNLIDTGLFDVGPAVTGRHIGWDPYREIYHAPVGDYTRRELTEMPKPHLDKLMRSWMTDFVDDLDKEE